MLDKKIHAKFNKALKEKGVFELADKLHKKFKESEVYLVGGGVRDIIIGRKVKDIDILVCKIKIKDLERELKKLGKVDLVGQRFSILKFTSKGDRAIDIAIPRKDFALGTGVYKDVKVKSDSNISVEEDLLRRDFAVNAMAWDILNKKLIDPFAGQKDLNKKIIKAVGKPEERFKEDYSRMLRAIRFACQLDFKIEKNTWSAIKKNIRHINDKIKEDWKVPREVISGEFLKSFDADPKKTIELYLESGAMKKMIPEIVKLKGCTQPKDYHSEGDVLTHTLLALENIKKPYFKKYFKEPLTLTTKVAILLHDIAKPITKTKRDGKVIFYNHDKKGAKMARKILERLKMSAPPDVGINTEEIVWLIGNHLLFLYSDPKIMKKTTIEKYLFNPNYSGISHMQLFLADALATKPQNMKIDLTRFKSAMKIMKEMKETRKEVPPKSILDGDEVMKILKIKPSSKVGEILDLLREEQLNGRVKTKAQALEFIKLEIGNL